MELHTIRSLYDKWNKKHEDIKISIKKLKEKQKNSTDAEEQEQLYWDIRDLAMEVNVIGQMLVDLGLMVYVEENKSK